MVKESTKDAFSDHIPDPALESLKKLESLAELMDSKFKIPGTNFRFGLDPIISLFPVVGDGISYLISLYLVMTMVRHGVSKGVATKMALNATLDALIGSIPVLGSVFDFYYKANEKNIKLLKEYYYQKKYAKVSKFDRSALAFCVMLFGAVFYMYLYFFSIDNPFSY